MSQNQIIYQIVEYLAGLKSQSNVNSENIDLITATLKSEFEVSQTPDNFTNLSYYPSGLSEIVESGVKALNLQTFSESLVEAESNPKFDAFVEVVEKKGYFQGTEKGSLEFLMRQAKLIKKFKEKALQSAGPTQAELESQAEDLKFKGNTAINAKDFDSAAKLYSEALKLTPEGPNSHVYYSNRAAAYCHLNRYQDAVDDCHSSIALVPDYVKAFSRLGLSNFFLEKYEDAVEAYERAVELEPDNKSSQDSLRQARNKLKKTVKSTSVAESPAGGMPDMSALAGMMGGGGGGAGLAGMMNNPNMKQAMDQMGGSAGLASLMKDPQMMAMAQQMMKDPSMMQKAMSMLGGAGGGGGDMPDMSALAGMMGGAGGNSPAAPSSSSSKTGAKKPFTGFEE
jgi:small glutamine-rich tetratricopeptide repeat-containing protein alpha